MFSKFSKQNNRFIMQRSTKKEYRIIGMMSGTSLDGVDLACCRFQKQQKWTFALQAAKTYPYPEEILSSINTMQDVQTSFLTFKKHELIYSEYLSKLILDFIQQKQLKGVDYISLHGHTIFHRPHEQVTIQVSNLPLIAAQTQIDVIGNFRELDVMRGGQGAPLAPFGEAIFQGDIFINFGGVANIGCQQSGWDINFCNLFFNHFANLIDNVPFDSEGKLGRKGQYQQDICNYFQHYWINKQEKSLQRENFQSMVQKVIDQFKETKLQDIMTTFYHFLAKQIVSNIKKICKRKQIELQGRAKKSILCSGGGARNSYLIELIKAQSQSLFELNVTVADEELLQFKEAIIFAFLGIKFLENEKNCQNGIGGMLAKGSK